MSGSALVLPRDDPQTAAGSSHLSAPRRQFPDTLGSCRRGGLWLVSGWWEGICGLWRVSRVRWITLAVV
jgi:fatty acid desaturase